MPRLTGVLMGNLSFSKEPIPKKDLIATRSLSAKYPPNQEKSLLTKWLAAERAEPPALIFCLMENIFSMHLPIKEQIAVHRYQTGPNMATNIYGPYTTAMIFSW